MDINSLRLILFFGTLAAMFCIETWRPRRVWQTPRLRRFSFHMTTSIVNTVITRAVCMAPFLALLWWSNENAWGLAHWLKLNGIIEIIATIIVLDLFDYWWHRFNHYVPFLWRFHRYHHMDTHVDVTTALRFHPGELVLSFIAKAIWVLIWGPSIFAFALFETLITVYAIFHHSNIDFADPVEKVIRLVHMTPRVHASHHTLSKRTRNANYSTIFILWDYMFKTFAEPDKEELKALGIDEGQRDHLTWKAYFTSAYKTID